MADRCRSIAERLMDEEQVEVTIWSLAKDSSMDAAAFSWPAFEIQTLVVTNKSVLGAPLLEIGTSHRFFVAVGCAVSMER